LAEKIDPQKPVIVQITLGPLETDYVQLTDDQLCRLLAHVGNHVVSWMRYDLKDPHDIPVVCNEGRQKWRSDTGKCESNEPE
jgi:hypothetical protein